MFCVYLTTVVYWKYFADLILYFILSVGKKFSSALLSNLMQLCHIDQFFFLGEDQVIASSWPDLMDSTPPPALQDAGMR